MDFFESLIKKAEALVKEGKIVEAMWVYDEAQEIKPDDLDLQSLRANYLANLTAQGRDREYISGVINSYLKKAYLLYQQGNFKPALDLLDKGIKIAPNIPNLYGLKASICTQIRNFEEGVRCYKKVLEMDITKEQRFSTLHSLGYLLTMLKRYDESIKFTDEALSLNPRDNTLYYNKGTALQRWGKSKEAIKALDKGLSLNPEKSMKIKFLLNKGNAFSDLNKNQKAVTCFKEILSIDPANKTAQDMISKLS